MLDTFATIAGLHPESLGAYVVSMAQAPSDVLAVAWLQRLAGAPLRDRAALRAGGCAPAAADTMRALLGAARSIASGSTAVRK